MVSGQELTTAQPALTPASLRAQIEATQVSLNDALARRAGIVARIDAAGGPGERVQLRNGPLRGVDGEINRFEAQLAGLRAELQVREATAANPPAQPVPIQPAPPAVAIDIPPPAPPIATTSVPPSTGIDLNGAALGGIATAIVLVPLAFAIAWRAGRRAAFGGRRLEGVNTDTRLARMEDAIAGIALDVERLSEGQRFLTNALVAETAPPQVREEFGM
jgi:hypothetical protein